MKPLKSNKQQLEALNNGVVMLSKPLNNFKDYGFTADFEGEILKKVAGYYIGSMRYKVEESYAVWDYAGVLIHSEYTEHIPEFDLTPVKPKWYEDENAFRMVMFLDKQGEDTYLNILFGEDFVKKPVLKEFENKPNGWRLATNEEIDSLKL